MTQTIFITTAYVHPIRNSKDFTVRAEAEDGQIWESSRAFRRDQKQFAEDLASAARCEGFIHSFMWDAVHPDDI